MTERLYINDVAVRDGFQIEKIFIPTPTKISLINQLSRTGLHKIEVTSFVSPKHIPALADNDAVLAGIERITGVVYVALVPNIRGAQNAAHTAKKPDEINVVMSVSETHNRANINRTHAQSLSEMPTMLKIARDAGMAITISLSTTFGCPFEGPVSEDAVAASIRAQGVACIAVGDAAGGAHTFDRLAAHPPAAANSLASVSDFSLMLYTSGTTGRGKGVPRRHRWLLGGKDGGNERNGGGHCDSSDERHGVPGWGSRGDGRGGTEALARAHEFGQRPMPRLLRA